METDPQYFLLKSTDTDPWSLLPPDRVRQAQGICDYMLGEARLAGDANATLTELCERYVAADLPLARCASIVRLLHSINVAVMRVWDKDNGASHLEIPYGSNADDGYLTSPPALAHKLRDWIAFDPRDLSDGAFGIITDLKETGITHYVCAPVVLANGMEDVFTFATKAPGGFSTQDIAFLRATFPALAACQEILVLHRMLKEVTRMYVGEEPHKRILAGDVHRGEVTHIESAILFADMRDFTSLTASMSAEQITTLLNDYYDCIVPAVESSDGEVLKFIGDGILAIFRTTGEPSAAVARALTAAQAGLRSVAARNTEGEPQFEIGIALHYGNVAYGNVGSGERLDYTVVGRDVNLASRIAGLCGDLNQYLLISEDIREHAQPDEFVDCGKHRMKGLSELVRVYAQLQEI